MAPRQLVEIGPGCVVIFVKIHRDPKFSLCQKILPGSNERYLGILKVPIQIDTVSIHSSILSNALWIKTGENQERKLPQFWLISGSFFASKTFLSRTYLGSPSGPYGG